MEKTIPHRGWVERNIHEFYCDGCNKYLGKTFEYDDGYYADIGECEYRFNVDGWYKIKRNLCPECKKKLIDNIQHCLVDLGFERN